MAANTRGVGKMEQFEFAAAVPEFEEVTRLAPDWMPGHINLAISLLNQDKPEQLAQARQILADVLAKDPDNKHAHYCLGILCSERGPFADAYPHFAAVNKLDPQDAHTWLRLGLTHPAGKDSAEARDCFEQALKQNPYLNAARYNLALALRATDAGRAKTLLADKTALSDAEWETPSRVRYSEMGKYADVIGRDATMTGKLVVGPLPMFELAGNFKVTLAPNARWATANDLDATRRAARQRFGGTIVLFDFNSDGKPDIFLASAVVENGKVRDLLLRNDGNGVFTDVTAAAGLATPRQSLGAAAADYNNDGKPDLVITGAGERHLFRNNGDGTFEDVSAAAGLDKVKGVCLGCMWVDIDQDGDLDLVLCQFTDKDTATFDGPATGGQLILFENIGIAGLAPAHAPPPGLSTAFRRSDKLNGVVPASAAVNVVATDIDGDQDVDVLLLSDAADPLIVENERLMRFKRTLPMWAAGQAQQWNGGLVLDANHDERSDLFLVRQGAAPVFLLSNGERDFAAGHTNSPPLKQAVTADIDMDGWADVIGLSIDRKPVLLHNQGDGRLEFKPDAFGPIAAGHALAVADLDGDGAPDLLIWSDDGLRIYRNLGNGNAAVLIDPSGRRDKGNEQRTNTDGIGTWVIAQSGSHWTGAERTTASAGLGQSLLPTALGIGKRGQADVVRLRWPDAVIQAELGINPGAITRIVEKNRKGVSCPVLMAWDGDAFVFVTDFLGGGSMGETSADGSTRPPRPEESVKIEPGQLVPKDGQYVIKIAEPMDEATYLDHLQLVVVDHPVGTDVFPDERFTFTDPQPTQKLLAFRSRYFPKLATDHRGRDVTKIVLHRDRHAVDTFDLRSWLGYAEDHSLTLDFGDLLTGGQWYMVLAGWTEYPYPESIYAATRAGVDLVLPTLERFDAPSGKWQPICDLGFPAGLPRVMTRVLPANFAGGRVRISTNMQVYWDQIYLAQAADAGAIGKVTALDVSRADLAARGFMQEIYPNGRPPIAYDDAKTETVPVTKWKGRLTRLGDVTDLLRAADDRFVLCGPGDEITVRFDASKLPALPKDWQRSFVLRTRGYCKDASTTTATGGTVEPLPFHAMLNYPQFGVPPPSTDADKWHTRPASGR
ncbi:MAG TPA: FG-GAP-like repeat-containing protein [Gemmataceae bacterium]|nr:FG-GAP-like repeat-containing protein [Gemmataceae bacterium]